MLKESIPNPTDEKVTEATKDFTPYFQRFKDRISSSEEVDAWSSAHIAQSERGIEYTTSTSEGEWEKKREVEMLRHNPKFVLRQWVLEELISKLEETGVERIQEGRKELARVLDVSHHDRISLIWPSCCRDTDGVLDVDETVYQVGGSWTGGKEALWAWSEGHAWVSMQLLELGPRKLDVIDNAWVQSCSDSHSPEIKRGR